MPEVFVFRDFARAFNLPRFDVAKQVWFVQRQLLLPLTTIRFAG